MSGGTTENAGPMMSNLTDQKCSTGKCGTKNIGPKNAGLENAGLANAGVENAGSGIQIMSVF